MNLINWNPLNRIDDFPAQTWGDFFRDANFGKNFSLLNKDLPWQPAADISETKKEFLVKAQLPGVDKDDVHISIEQDVLTIEGERKMEKSEKDEEMKRTESFYGKYSRSFSLPENIDSDKVKAKCKNGVLTVHLPKTKVKRSTAKEITVD